MASLDDVASNELVILVRHQGQALAFKAWKRALAAFADPGLWQDTARYGLYFEPLEGNGWGMAGYGLVVMDLDDRKTYSFNDYSTPWALYLPLDSDAGGEAAKLANKALMALLGAPEQWPQARLEVLVENGLLSAIGRLVAPGKAETSTSHLGLDQLLRPGTAAQEALGLLTVRRGYLDTDAPGLLGTGLGKVMVMGGQYLPVGWEAPVPVGQDNPMTLLACLERLQAAGIAAPASWEGLDHYFQSSELPVDEAALAQWLDELEEDGATAEMADEIAAARGYIALKSRWAGALPEVRKPGATGPH